MIRSLIGSTLTVLVTAALLLAHGNATHIMGTITANDGTHLTVKTQAGKSETVMLQKGTKYLTATKEAPAAATDLKIGVRVVIDAKMDQKMKMLMAEEVRIGVTAPAKTDGKAKAPTPSNKTTGHK